MSTARIENPNVQLLARVIAENPEMIRPCGSYHVVELFRPDEKSIGGIHLPHQVQERSNRVLARIIKAGPGQRSITTGELMPPTAKDGDLVIVTRHAAQMLTLEGVTCHVVADGDVLGIVDEAAILPIYQAELEKVEENAPAEPEGNVEMETEEGTVTELPSGILMVTKKEG